MSRRLCSLALALYPRPWRHRYGQELQDLCDECADREETASLHLAVGLAAEALRVRARSLALSPRRGLPVAVAALLVLATVAVPTDGFGAFARPAGRGALAMPAKGRPTVTAQAWTAAICSFPFTVRQFTVVPPGSANASLRSKPIEVRLTLAGGPKTGSLACTWAPGSSSISVAVGPSGQITPVTYP